MSEENKATAKPVAPKKPAPKKPAAKKAPVKKKPVVKKEDAPVKGTETLTRDKNKPVKAAKTPAVNKEIVEEVVVETPVIDEVTTKIPLEKEEPGQIILPDEEPVVEDEVDDEPQPTVDNGDRFIVRRSHNNFGTLWYTGDEDIIKMWHKKQVHAKEITQSELDELRKSNFNDAYGNVVVFKKTIVQVTEWKKVR